jgi:hypothetical protein
VDFEGIAVERRLRTWLRAVLPMLQVVDAGGQHLDCPSRLYDEPQSPRSAKSAMHGTGHSSADLTSTDARAVISSSGSIKYSESGY